MGPRTAYNRAWAEANRERRRAANNAFYARNRDRRNAATRARRAANPGKNAERCRQWRINNPARALALSKTRKASKAQRTPVWADLKKIEQVYEEARLMTVLMGEPWHVDHAIPLRGHKVSGLHVHTNLQLLPGIENVKKRNKFEVE